MPAPLKVELVDEGQQRRDAGQRRPARGEAVEPAGEGGDGEAGQHERSGEVGRGADPAGQRHGRHGERRAEHHGALA